MLSSMRLKSPKPGENPEPCTLPTGSLMALVAVTVNHQRAERKDHLASHPSFLQSATPGDDNDPRIAALLVGSLSVPVKNVPS